MVAFYTISAVLLLLSYVHLVKYEAWWIRIFDFVSVQLAITISVTILLGSVMLPLHAGNGIVLILLIATLIYHLRLIIPFTKVYRKQVANAMITSNKDRISIMVSNVYQYNTRYKVLLNLIKMVDADIVLLVETDKLWSQALSPLEGIYTEKVSYPLENTYGMILYSRLKVTKSEINFLVNKDTPSFELTVELPSGQQLDIYTTHPQPPSPTENERSTERDAELLQIAKKVKANDRPAIVMGDLNDVAWSHTTRLFKRISGLLDPRIGRGFFNTFHAKIFFMRFPLDHIFSSHHFKVGKIERLPFCHSDHFPIFLELFYEPKEGSEKKQEKADADDHKEANAKITEAKNS